MIQYHRLLEDVLENGIDGDDRTGVGTRSLFGTQTVYDLAYGFPAITTKKLAWKSVVGELLWMLEGSTDERRLAALTYGKPRSMLVEKRTIWRDNAEKQAVDLGYRVDWEKAELGPVYGAQMRRAVGYSTKYRAPFFTDQLWELVNGLKNSPESRRHVLNLWNVGSIPDMALPPCHLMSIFGVKNGRLDCLMTQRSADLFLGVPFNVAFYSLLTHILAREVGLEPGRFIHSIADAHIYKNHFEQVEEQLSRDHYPMSILRIDDRFKLQWTAEYSLDTKDMFVLDNYRYHPTIKAPMAV